MVEHLLTTMITIFMLTSAQSGNKTICRIADVPEIAFSDAPMTIAVEYSLPEEIDATKLHVELKNLSHDVYTRKTQEIRGSGKAKFEFECPAPQNEPMIVAAWMGQNWRDPLYPIQYSDPILVLPYEAYQQKLDTENTSQEEIRQKLKSLDYIRSTGKNVAILCIDIPDIDQQVIDHYVQALSHSGFEVAKLSPNEATDMMILSPKYFDFLMLTDIRLFPTPFMFPFMRYLQSGGKLIAFGAPAFQERIWRSGDRWVTEASYSKALEKIEPENIILDFEDNNLEGWYRGAANHELQADHIISSEGQNGGKCLGVKIHKLNGWDTFCRVLDTKEAKLIPEDALTIFWAKGDEKTRNIIVEIQEQDMSRWIATIRLQPEWKKYVLVSTDFEYWKDNPSKRRGGSNDRLHPENAKMISFGIAHGFAPYEEGGAYAYWVDDVGFATNLETAPPPKYALQLPIISPAYKIYQMGEVSKLWHTAPYAEMEKYSEVPIKDAWFPMPRHHGSGFNRNRKKRFIHLMDARHEDGTYRGSVCAMLLNLDKPWSPGAWIAVGTAEGNALTSKPITETVINASQRLTQDAFLAEAGAEHYSYYASEKMTVGAKFLNISNETQKAVVKMVLHNKNGISSVIAESNIEIIPGLETIFSKEVSAPDDPGSEWFINTELLMDNKRIDTIQQRFSIIAEPVEDASEYITISGGDFYYKGEKWYPYGINYWPSYIAGDEPYKRFGRWYNPELIERDLEQMKDMGMNMVSIQSTSFDDSRDFLDFITRIYGHGIRVNLFTHGSDPLRFDDNLVTKQIKGWQLDTNPAIFAYDLAWEHKLGTYNSRRRWDNEWANWIEERYGSLKSAEDDWDYDVPRSNEKITGPSDDQLTNDGEWRVMVAAYRRFVDDFVSEKYRHAVEKVKKMAPNQLISVRMGYGGTGPCHPRVFPIDLFSVAKHLEFLSPEGWGMNGSREQVLSGGFTTAYSDWASRGKPCFWCEWGMNIWSKPKVKPDPERIKEQGNQYHYFSEMFLRSGANGQAAWWLPGGFRVGENSDFGILSPDASWRPACHALKEWAPKLKESRERLKPDKWITIDRDVHPGGYWHVYNTHKDEYAQALLDGHLAGVRTQGTGTTSKDTPLIAVGNTKYNGNNPPKYLNAEFNKLEIKNSNEEWIAVSDGDMVEVELGKPVFVRASIGNIGEAKWLVSDSKLPAEGSVYLSSRTAKGINYAPIEENTSYLEDAVVSPFSLMDSISGKMEIEFEMTAFKRAWFGEKINVTLSVPK